VEVKDGQEGLKQNGGSSSLMKQTELRLRKIEDLTQMTWDGLKDPSSYRRNVPFRDLNLGHPKFPEDTAQSPTMQTSAAPVDGRSWLISSCMNDSHGFDNDDESNDLNRCIICRKTVGNMLLYSATARRQCWGCRSFICGQCGVAKSFKIVKSELLLCTCCASIPSIFGQNRFMGILPAHLEVDGADVEVHTELGIFEDSRLFFKQARIHQMEEVKRQRESEIRQSEGIYDEKDEAENRKSRTFFYDREKSGMQITVADFDVIAEVGKGMAGKVFRCCKKAGKDAGRFYAMKIIPKSWAFHSSGSLRHTKAERDILMQVEHPFVVKLRYAFQSLEKLYLVTDFYPGGSLRDALRKACLNHLRQNPKALSRSQVPSSIMLGGVGLPLARFWGAQLVLAIGHLHAQNIIHRDLKPENILIDRKQNLKLTDFGLSKNLGESASDRKHSFCGTDEYVAPELLRREAYGKPVDWWGFGIILHEMLVGRVPFSSPNPRQLYQKIMTQPLKFPNAMPPSAKLLLIALLQRDPKHRLGSEHHRAKVDAFVNNEAELTQAIVGDTKQSNSGPVGAVQLCSNSFFLSINWSSLVACKLPVPEMPEWFQPGPKSSPRMDIPDHSKGILYKTAIGIHDDSKESLYKTAPSSLGYTNTSDQVLERETLIPAESVTINRIRTDHEMLSLLRDRQENVEDKVIGQDKILDTEDGQSAWKMSEFHFEGESNKLSSHSMQVLRHSVGQRSMSFSGMDDFKLMDFGAWKLDESSR
jgi:serine/threonine protein kinase